MGPEDNELVVGFGTALIVVAMLLVVVAILVLNHQMEKRRQKKRKMELINAVILPVVNEVFDQAEYIPNGSISKKVVTDSLLFDYWTDYKGEDYVTGLYKGLRIHMSDIKLWHHSFDRSAQAEPFTGKVIDFDGQWVVCDFGRELAARVTLRLHREIGYGLFHKLFEDEPSGIKMENPEFNELYTVLADDPMSAYRVRIASK